MEQPRSSIKFGKISFQRSRSVPSQTLNERMGTIDEPGTGTGTERSKGKSQLSKCYPSNIPDNPQEAMMFLSRSWSPSSSNFFQILSTNSLDTSHENSETDEEGQSQEIDKSLVDNQSSTNQLDQLLVWLREELFSSLSKSCRRKRKEVLRLHEAQVHAALAVARLAAAIAGTVTNSNIQVPNSFCLSNQKGNACSVVASAAALVATVCAEAAQAVGAKRNEVASAIRFGLQTQSSAHMLTLTATAATCLRGVATLNQRAESNRSLPEGYMVLQKGARMHLCMPTGKIQVKVVSICWKNEKIMLRLGTRHLRGAFTSYEECKMIIFEQHLGGMR